jgi:AraC-like DNA-binding protein
MLFADSEINVCENELFIINPLQPHAIPLQVPHDYAVITVRSLSAAEMTVPRDDCPVFHQHVSSLQCKQLFVKLLDAIQNGDRREVAAQWDRLFAYLCQYQRKDTNTAGASAIVKKTMSYIAANYQNPITVNELAKENCMSAFHYCRTFKSLTGLSPHKYLIQYRLSISHKSLQNNEPVFDAAINAGFYDSSHFIRSFYSRNAVSPTLYRQSILKNSKNIQ